MEYLGPTIAAYDKSWQKYEERTRNNLPTEELEKFCSLLSDSSMILDAGCAYGNQSNLLTQRGHSVEGIDLSSAFIARAKELYPGIHFSLMDIRDLQFEDECFDGIWANAVLLHLTDRDIASALDQFHRVLKPAGILFVSFKKGNGVGNQLETFTADDQRFYNLKEMTTIAPMLEAHGFEVVGSTQINENVRNKEVRDLEWINILTRKVNC